MKEPRGGTGLLLVLLGELVVARDGHHTGEIAAPLPGATLRRMNFSYAKHADLELSATLPPDLLRGAAPGSAFQPGSGLALAARSDTFAARGRSPSRFA
jgi:hypothetical protein